MSRYTLLVDLTRCFGCQACSVACQTENGLDGAEWWTRTEPRVQGRFPALNTVFALSRQCYHCSDAPCVDACPTGANYKDRPTGSTGWDPSRCVGCRSCEAACPFGAREFHHKNKTFGKCTHCLPRVRTGLQTACSTTCPAEARLSGTQPEMIKVAKQRLTQEKSRDPRFKGGLYGLSQMGGLGTILLLARPAREYGLPEHPRGPFALDLWQKGAKPAGALAVAGALGALGLNFLVTRREKVEGAEREAGESGSSKPPKPTQRGSDHGDESEGEARS